ncbi:HlyD family type I secretion periplasmic adaptor subunit [Massilia sp. CF038]|uniref:HlyD family type I secretion periplasmic adaptor subunit n=1 Tax=Massilia sp. CF038 TaxID=1881045 RepID=UPI00091DE5F3|nr:HlyD family type I secretion periplasmic adaptor subunit [Massilia sp. CF038]SHG62043.1 HlyD family secretion protein [Massilia sp. CF038]
MNGPLPIAGAPAPLRPPSRWHDPLGLIQTQAPSVVGRIVLWSVAVLVLLLIVWAWLGQLDIIASAEGKLVPRTLLKVVQPAEPGVVTQLLVDEGDRVKAGQVLAMLDTTVARAEQAGVSSDLALQQLQARRIEAELAGRPMLSQAGDDVLRTAQVQGQYQAHRKAFTDSLAQEQSLLAKARHEHKSAAQILSKLEQTLPIYDRAAASYAKLEKEGFYGGLATADKQREALEKARDLDAQRSTLAALSATISAQEMRISQIQSNYRSELEKELAEVRLRISQLQPTLDKSAYKTGLMALRAPQDGVVKDLATTTVGAVVQPGSVVLTIVPEGEPLYADVALKNEDVGFVHEGQSAQVKLIAYPFQRHGMLTGKVIRISADAVEPAPGSRAAESSSASAPQGASYKARVRLDQQVLNDAHGNRLAITPGMQVVAEINQGQRSVLEYLLSPVRKTVHEAARER